MPFCKQRYSIRYLTPWIMWGLAVSAYFIEYLVRVAPTAMVPNLMESFNASPIDISAFAAYFLYAYVLMQIPVGILVDRFGPKLCLSLSTALCAFMTLLFCLTDDLHTAKIARLLLGGGAAFAWIGTLKVALAWFKPQLFSILVGCTQALGMIGGALGASLMGRLTEQQGWQISTQFFGIMLAILAVLILVFVQNHPPSSPRYPSQTLPLKQELSIVFKSRQTWLISIFAGLLFMPTAVFAELWGSFYLTTTQDLSTTAANDGISYIFLGYAVGGPLSGILANRLGRRPMMIFSAFSCLVLISSILYLPTVPWYLLYLLLFIYGFCNSGMVAAYTAVAELNTKAAGIALGFVNGMSVIVGAFCQQWVGALIDWLHTQSQTNTLNYTASELKMAMSIVVIGTSIAFILSFFTKETLKKHSSHSP